MPRQLQSVLGTLGPGRLPSCGCATASTDGQPRTLDEIGRAFKLSRERIRQIERETMARAASPLTGPGPADYLDLVAKSGDVAQTDRSVWAIYFLRLDRPFGSGRRGPAVGPSGPGRIYRFVAGCDGAGRTA